MMLLKISLCVIGLMFPSCIAFPDYPPTTTCQMLYPHHDKHQAQASPAPYTITVKPARYTPGSHVTVRINGSSNFKGFILQARQTGTNAPPYPVGTFNTPLPEYSQHIWCSGGDPRNTVGHNHSRGHEFTSVAVTWRAPDAASGNITFWATVVRNFETFWVNVQSDVVIGQAGVAPGAPTSGPDIQITKNGCGKTKGCFSEPAQCIGSGDCLLLVTYENQGDEVIFEMSSRSGYGALGFNYKQQMDGTDSITCSTSATAATDVVDVRRYYLDEHRPRRHDLRNSTDITSLAKSYTDGIVKCRFSRKKTPQGARMRDLNTNWYLIFAWGQVSSTGVVGYHASNSSFTSNKANFTEPTILASGKAKPSPSPSDKITKNGCAKTKACISEPKGCRTSSDCEYLMTYTVVKDVVTFEMSTTKGWSAVGFNSKPRMDGTDAIICSRKPTGGKVEVAHYSVIGYSTPTKNTQNPSPLNVIESQYNNGVTYCKFSRSKKAVGMMDLTRKVHLIFARGQITPQGGLQKHSPREKSFTTEAVAITSIGQAKVSEGKDLTLIRAHAILMSLAWLVCASLAMFVARYMKEVWGELFGLKAWFQVHRGLMILALLFTIIGIILAIVYAQGWSETKLAHPLIGIIVLVLSCVQPVMAFFRPKPGSERRLVFNWAHRSVGVVSLILAVVNCFLGMLLPHFELHVIGVYPLIVYCAGVAIVLLFEVVVTLKARSQSCADLDAKVDMKQEDVQVHPKPALKLVDQNKLLKKFMFGFLILLVSGVMCGIIFLVTRPLKD